MPAVYPRCRLGKIEPYIAADGYYMPCCWIGNHPKYGMLREFLGDDFKQLDARENSIEQMESSTAMRRIRDSWENGDLQPCVDFCGEPFRTDENHWRDYELYVDLSTVEGTDG